ncbi:M24 family metallopeptidase [soil metagenome]
MSTVAPQTEMDDPGPRLLAASANELADRRKDIEQKQAWAASVLADAGCEGLLVLEPENFAWLTSGATARGVLDPREMPAVYFSADQRWLISANVDSQRLFDEELNGLGFQLKEWSWYNGREQLLADLCHGRVVASDRPLTICKTSLGELMRQRRRMLSLYEQECLKALGELISHALEATCRTLSQGETEREVAGQISHRLLHRGATPINISVTAEGRSRMYRQAGFTSLPVERSCSLIAMARKYGLCAAASRSMSFGKPEPELQKEHDVATRVSATYMASSWPDAITSEVLNLGRRIYQVSGMENEWRLAPQGFVTGRAPIEQSFRPGRQDLIQAGWPIVWTPTAGAAVGWDTFIVADNGAQLITPAQSWPMRRIRIQGTEILRPDIFVR